LWGRTSQVKRVLVVDADAQFRAVLRHRLKRERYEVCVAADGPDALRKASTEPFDLMILDVQLPGIDGLEVLQRVRSDPGTEDMPVIVLSALSGRAYSDRAAELGADECIAKPVSLQRLIAEIRGVLGGRAAVADAVRDGTSVWPANHT
jgi:DNA-binding response OmpR family regulator